MCREQLLAALFPDLYKKIACESTDLHTLLGWRRYLSRWEEFEAHAPKPSPPPPHWGPVSSPLHLRSLNHEEVVFGLHPSVILKNLMP